MKIQVLQLIDANLTEKNQYMKDIRNKEVIVMISVILTVVIFITYNIVKHGM